MLPLTKVMCPTDFSEPAAAALASAAELVAHFGGELVLVHVLDPAPTLPTTAVLKPPGGGRGSFDVAAYQKRMVADAEKQMDALVEQLPQADLVVRKLIPTDAQPADVIVELAEQEDVDVIVIATLGRSAFSRFLFGSVAERVVREAACPVLTIRARPAPG